MPGEVLLVTADGVLDESVARLSALAGRPVATIAASGVTGPLWAAASIVLVRGDAAAALADRRLPRRNRVLVLARDTGPSDDGQELLRGVLAVGAEDVLHLPQAEARLLRLLALAGRPGRATVMGVVGARGGAGATTLACALAVTATRRGMRVALIDADPLGAGVDLALGTEDAPGARWSQLVHRDLDISEGALERVLPDLGGLLVLSCDEELVAGARGTSGESFGAIPGAALTAALSGLRLSHDLVVVDVPRQWPHEVSSGLDLLDSAVLVATAEVRATAAAVRVLHRLRSHVEDIRLVVRGPAPGGLSAGAVAEALKLPLAAELPPEPGLDTAYERGLPPARKDGGPLATCARLLLHDLVSAAAVAA